MTHSITESSDFDMVFILSCRSMPVVHFYLHSTAFLHTSLYQVVILGKEDVTSRLDYVVAVPLPVNVL